MEKRYIVKESSVATEDNPRYSGEHSTYYYGKGCELLGREGTHLPYYNDTDHLIPMAKCYGYTRKGDAKRNWAYKNPENSKFWKSTVEIIEIEV